MTIVADSRVSIDLLKNRNTRRTCLLRHLVERNDEIGIGDLMLTEVLRRTRDARDFAYTLARLMLFDGVTIAGARNGRLLRALASLFAGRSTR